MWGEMGSSQCLWGIGSLQLLDDTPAIWWRGGINALLVSVTGRVLQAGNTYLFSFQLRAKSQMFAEQASRGRMVSGFVGMEGASD